MTDDDPNVLVTAARQLLDDHARVGGSGWARGTAFLTRQALEAAVANYWHRRAPGMDTCDGRAQLVALRFYLAAPTMARLAHQTWASLSHACHHHAYELAPTAAELQRWIETVCEIINALDPPKDLRSTVM